MIRATPVPLLDTALEAVTLNIGDSQRAIAEVKFILKSTSNNTFVVIIEGLLASGTVWRSLSCIDMAQLTVVAAGNITLSNSTDYIFVVPDALGFDKVRLKVVSAVGGSFDADALGFEGFEIGSRLFPVATTVAQVANNISVSSATAFTVGPNGTTNPAFTVVTNTSSGVTGLKITNGAAAAGVALLVTSSGTNEPMTIDTKGTGVLSLNTTATGQIYHSRGAQKVLVFGATTTALGTVQSSTPTIAQILGGILTQTSVTGAGTVTLPTGTAISAGMPLAAATGDTFDCLLTNLGGGQVLTVTGATGSTVVGGAAVASAKTSRLTFTCTGANAWTIHCNTSA